MTNLYKNLLLEVIFTKCAHFNSIETKNCAALLFAQKGSSVEKNVLISA